MVRLVPLVEKLEDRPNKYQKENPPRYLVNSDHVGLVAPRSTYTALLVAGTWIHVNHPYEEVLQLLEMEVSL